MVYRYGLYCLMKMKRIKQGMIINTNSIMQSKCWSGLVLRTTIKNLPDVDFNYASGFFYTKKWAMRKINSRFIKPLSPVSWCWHFYIPWSDIAEPWED